MSPAPLDFDPRKLAAVVYQPGDDADTLLAEFADDVACRGTRVGGVVQRNVWAGDGNLPGMQLVDLLTTRVISISQPKKRGTSGCRLDPAGLAEAASAVARAVDDRVGLVIVNKFSKQEASGQGLRGEIALAVSAGLPVLTAVPAKFLDAWTSFTADNGTTLACARSAIDAWWAGVAR
jgi:nucleoside-triphosphatase THEP1